MTSLRADNLRFLLEQDPDLISELDAHAFSEATVAVVAAKKGGLTLVHEDRFVHSKYDPVKEAERGVGADRAWLHLHFGLGLGHFLAADPPSKGGGVLIFEPNPDFLSAALDHVDFKALFGQKRVFLTCSTTRFKEKLSLCMKSDRRVKRVISPYHQRRYGDALTWFEKTIDEVHFNNAIATRTVRRAGQDLTVGALKALKYTTRLPGVERLRHAFAKQPAVIVSAGPSLDAVLPDLIPMRDHCLIFGQARTCRSLEKVGIRPHFLVHNEFKPLVRFIDGCTNLADTTFLLSEQADPDYFTFPHGRTFVFQSLLNFAGRWVTAHFPGLEKHKLETGGSVACDAFSLALLFGCDPIVLIGQDLAMKGDRYYAESKTNHRFDHEEADVRRIKGFFAEEVTTVSTYLSYLLWFQDQAEVINARGKGPRLVNATEGGAFIEGFEQLKLREVAWRYSACAPVSQAVIEAAAAVAPDQMLTREQLTAFRDDALAKAATLRELCDSCLRIDQRIREALVQFGVRNIHQVQSDLGMLDKYNQVYAHLQANLAVLSGFVQEELSELAAGGAVLSEMEVAEDMAGLADQIALELDAFVKSYGVTLKALDQLEPLLRTLV